MGFRSYVKILCEPNAYEMVMDSINKFNAKEHAKGRDWEFRPDRITKNSKDNLYLLEWSWVKWYDEYEDVQSVENVLTQLKSLNKEQIDGYRYTKCILNEDNTTEEDENDGENWYKKHSSYLEVICQVITEGEEEFKEI